MKTYIIERDIPGVEQLDRAAKAGASKQSNSALAQLAPKVQWVHSYIARDKTFCVYRATDEEVIRKHAELSGFPATRITPITGMLDPTMAD
jgi:hypothetical protein